METAGQSTSQDVSAPSDTTAPSDADASRLIVLIGPDAAALKEPMQARTGDLVGADRSLLALTRRVRRLALRGA